LSRGKTTSSVEEKLADSLPVSLLVKGAGDAPVIEPEITFVF
jgi:hypothetical protein